MNKKEYAIDMALEAMLKAEAPDIEDKIAEDLLTGFEGQEHEFSEKHKNDMKKLFKKERKAIFYGKLSVYSKRAAIILLAVTAISTATVGSVSALRTRFMNFIIEITQQDTNIKFNNDNIKSNSYVYHNIKLEYIPSGFIIKKSESRNGYILLEFTKDNEFFNFRTINMESSLSIDTEDAIVKELTINGKEAFLSIKDSTKILVWHDDSETAYILTGNISENELIKIAENKI